MLQILRKLKHENIIEMLDSFESPQEFCVVTEFAQVMYNYLLILLIRLDTWAASKVDYILMESVGDAY